MDRQLVGEIASLRDLDRIDLADQVSDADVWRRELLRVAVVTADPGDRGGIALLLDEAHRVGRDGMQRVVMQLCACHGRDPRVEQ